MALKTVAENVGPGDGEPAIRGPERRYRYARRRKNIHPRPVGPEPRPTRAAQREHGRARIDRTLSVGCLKQQMTILVPTGPTMAQLELHTDRVQPPQPRPQQR